MPQLCSTDDVIMETEAETRDEVVVEVTAAKMDVEPRADAAERADKTSDESSSHTAPSSSGPAAVQPVIMPSLKGILRYVGEQLTCKGKWAMCDADHANALLTSDFEFHLVEALDASAAHDHAFPVDGRYQGWFNVKQAPPLKPLRVEDKDMEMKFESRNDHYAIAGQGHNFYGKFNLRGTLTKDGEAHIYREYYHLNPPPAAVQRKLAAELKRKADAVPSSSGASSGRTRKPTAIAKEAEAAVPKSRAAAPAPVPVADASQRAGERSHRLTPALRRCAELLKEISKMPQSVWFLEPVDPVKFNIPEYPKIIKHPMDFSTIKANLESGVYETPEDFAAHVRLVFKNAITFNTDRESLVHIAAKDMGVRFEDKFRVLQAHFAPDTYVDAEPVLRAGKSSSSKSRTPATAAKAPRESAFFADRERRRSAPGPRVQTQTAFIPPAAVDPSTLLMMEMQKKMESMQAELSRLRSAMQENALKDRVEETVEAAKKPLTLDEKKTLVTQIYKLAPEKMERALDIIRESISTTADDGEIEIPIDSLDTLTLRRLQKFVQDHAEKKKRPGGGSGSAREPPVKKNKKPAKNSSNSSISPAIPSDDADLGLFDDHEPLLFESGQLDSTPLKLEGSAEAPSVLGTAGGGFADTFNDEDDEDDDNKWGQDDSQTKL